MGTITISVQSASPAVNASKTFTFSDADMARFYAAYQALGPTMSGNPGATFSINQGLLAWAQGVISSALNTVKGYEMAQAAPQPLVVT